MAKFARSVQKNVTCTGCYKNCTECCNVCMIFKKCPGCCKNCAGSSKSTAKKCSIFAKIESFT